MKSVSETIIFKRQNPLLSWLSLNLFTGKLSFEKKIGNSWTPQPRWRHRDRGILKIRGRGGAPAVADPTGLFNTQNKVPTQIRKEVCGLPSGCPDPGLIPILLLLAVNLNT